MQSSTKERWGNFLFITPYLLVFIFMIALPLFWGIYLSFQKVDLFGPGKFVGWSNYVRLFDNKIFIQTIWNTCYFVLLTVPALVVLGLGLAMALNQQTRTANILRGVFFASTILSVTVVTLIWRIIFIPNDGFMSMVFNWLNLEAIPFLSSPDWALKSIAIATIWWCLGLPMILFTAALQQIPKDLYEAAQLDNASKWTTFRKITLPSITRTIILVTIIEIVMQFQLFGQALLMTNGGPNNTSRSIVMFIYDAGFRRWDIGMAAAASQVLFLIILVAAIAQFMISRKKG
ncbi:sugar ABC transporter permease [Vibrio diazotrophicus]|jgi:multiple sugar transport system permease protein|uniref:Sugar ABC transporter permease n=2 Tax=Vibrionaceae TaxID=641 RepID=A0A2J8HA00_VIBDI|nr:sugar ABC transporter permease [Vibrio diazotrophicus]PNH95087.1 sugar ABC transporter permease [Vibrio diazotrophicus]PNI03213.1 sugar ABC transporter permease [Vibrio diazotrophicus]PNI04045.1 sugar ABC transporter permease [Vibrio diazotrophicus]